ncbi:MAG: marine proteobacterial sortase target protein [Hyphomicrobiaceae bacterium]
MPKAQTAPDSLRRTLAVILGLTIAHLGLLLGAIGAMAGEAPQTVKPEDAQIGTLLFESEVPGRFVEAPRLGSDYDVTVSGPTARTRVTQRFYNPTDGWVEAVYVFPLPAESAVDTLRMVIGNRVIIGDIKERQEAKRIYEEAKASGQKASLVEQERPNIFTNSVANIGPHESIVVQIEYQETVRLAGGEFSFRLPLVVGPRYSPKPIVQTVDFGGNGQGGWGQLVDPVPDRNRLESPVLDPRTNDPINPTTITVHLNAGFALAEVVSHHHPVKIEGAGDSSRLVTLAEGAVPADRDFELTWKPAPSVDPSVGLFQETIDGTDYLLAVVTPPTVASSEKPLPREVVFVIDNSGSMGGTSIVDAKASLLYALGRLKPEDRFNVIRFDDTMDTLFPDTVPASADNLGTARIFVDRLDAAGGTEMIPPMQRALADPRPADGSFLRQVVFLTDGAIGNEQQLFDVISASRGRSRIFTVGIGSAPNTYLMTRAAELGRGTFTHIASEAQVQERMKALFEKLESPAVTGLSARFQGATADLAPKLLPDIYRGEPLVLAAQLDKLAGNLEIGGTIGNQPWAVKLPLAAAKPGLGISAVWARRRIADHEVSATLGGETREAADAAILKLALGHHLVTRLTSLVAVDRTPSRPAGERLTRADIPLNLPAGWDFDKVFGPAGEGMGQRADNGAANPVVGDPQLIDAIVTKPQPRSLKLVDAQKMVFLPKTATDAELRLMLGLLLLLVASLLALLARRSRHAE